MIAMPYILVDIVLSKLAPAFFCIAAAVLLSKYPWANRWLPGRLGHRRGLAFVAHASVLTVLSILAVYVVATLGHLPTRSAEIYDWFVFAGLAICMLLAYQFMDARYLRSTPPVPRRLLIGLLSLVVTVVPAVVAVTALVGLLIIK
jgi:hypothetical protein